MRRGTIIRNDGFLLPPRYVLRCISGTAKLRPLHDARAFVLAGPGEFFPRSSLALRAFNRAVRLCYSGNGDLFLDRDGFHAAQVALCLDRRNLEFAVGSEGNEAEMVFTIDIVHTIPHDGCKAPMFAEPDPVILPWPGAQAWVRKGSEIPRFTPLAG